MVRLSRRVDGGNKELRAYARELIVQVAAPCRLPWLLDAQSNIKMLRE